MARILVDTSVWVDHFRRANGVLESLIVSDQVLCHPLIVIELACGTPPAPRERTLSDFKILRQAVVASTDETLSLIEKERCYNLGCGAVDLALLASALLTRDALLWTVDKKLDMLAQRLGIAYRPLT
jgi:predicted nucleic acid-binding protein